MDHPYAQTSSEYVSTKPFTGIVLGTFLGVICLLGFALSLQAQATSLRMVKDFEISAGPLENALNQLGHQAGILLSYSPQLTQGKHTSGFSGSYTLQQASSKLLRGSGLRLIQLNDNSYQLQETDVIEGKTLIITAEPPLTGRVEDGYRLSQTTDIGPITGRKLLDTPYSISTLPSTLFENINAARPSDVQRISPFVQLGTSQNSVFTNSVDLRGFAGSGWNQKFLDGMRASSLAMTPMEDKERMEVITGLSGFLYGMSSPGGIINYVFKRPTEKPLRDLTLGNYGGESYFAHADVSDRFTTDGRSAYRLNLVAENGDTIIDEQSRERYLFSSAIDFQITPDLLLQLNASYSDDHMQGPTPFWTFSDGHHPLTPDNSKQWGQNWSGGAVDTFLAGIKLKWHPNADLAFRAGLTHSRTNRSYLLSGNLFIADSTYIPTILAVAPQRHDNIAGYLFADTKFNLGSTAHTFTTGLSSDYYKTREHQDDSVFLPLTTARPFSEPVALPAVSYTNLAVGKQEARTATTAENFNWILADTIFFNPQWSAIVGLTYTTIQQTSYDFRTTGAIIEQYDRSDTNPSLSLIFKPTPSLSTYFTYMEGLEKGGIAPINADNAGQLLAPINSQQYELGVKAALDDIHLTLALFNVQRTNEFLDTDNVYKQDGHQKNRGIELSATGKLSDRLTLIGGLSLIDAELSNYESNDPVGVAEQLFKLYGEYNLNGYIDNLTLTAGAYYTGKRAVNLENNAYLPAYTLLDLGARYELRSLNTPMTLTLNVKNLLNEDYWSNSTYLGEPRSITFAAKMKF